MVTMGPLLDGLSRCPHCGIAKPNMVGQWEAITHRHDRSNERRWGCYVCQNCGGAVTAETRFATMQNPPADFIYPHVPEADTEIPERARAFLQQAMESLHAPALAIMGAASCVDAMLKERGYSEGSLYSRINQAKDDHLITEDMAAWAHQVRLDANDQRHADEDAGLPDEAAAKLVIDFTVALAEILFVLPARVTRGLAAASGSGAADQRKD